MNGSLLGSDDSHVQISNRGLKEGAKPSLNSSCNQKFDRLFLMDLLIGRYGWGDFFRQDLGLEKYGTNYLVLSSAYVHVTITKTLSIRPKVVFFISFWVTIYHNRSCFLKPVKIASTSISSIQVAFHTVFPFII